MVFKFWDGLSRIWDKSCWSFKNQPPNRGKTFRPRKILPQFRVKKFRPRRNIPRIQGKIFRPREIIHQIQGILFRPQRNAPQIWVKKSRPQENMPRIQGKTFRLREIIPWIQSKKFRPQKIFSQISGKVLYSNRAYSHRAWHHVTAFFLSIWVPLKNFGEANAESPVRPPESFSVCFFIFYAAIPSRRGIVARSKSRCFSRRWRGREGTTFSNYFTNYPLFAAEIFRNIGKIL